MKRPKSLLTKASPLMLTIFSLFCANETSAQDKLYNDQFSIDDITLLDGKFKDAMDLNIDVLMSYDMDRLLQPFYREAGLDNGAVGFDNWADLSGQIGGHYLSALAIHYAAVKDPVKKEMLKTRLDQMIKELKICQDASETQGTHMIGYLGGIPNSKNMWNGFRTGNFTLYNQSWVAWYNIHKIYAGLRDAYLYADIEEAKDMFLKLCDWGVLITEKLSDAQMETMLNIEHGGMNEPYADAYQWTGEQKYLDAAKRFSHKSILNGCAAKDPNFLNNLHANTQVPKAIGFQRVYELDKSLTNYGTAATFFWEDIVENRTLALGGNSRNEHFTAPAACGDYITSREGPESCNTYNMLKLSEDLFRLDQDARYADFYEQALFNHILSTQHPEHGGYVYFTPARPCHYRVYSQVNQAMWCCVGTGMENHGKYGQFIYTHNNDDLFVNLYIASELKWKEKDVTFTQATTFPYSETSTISISAAKPETFALNLRYPKWSKDVTVTINGEKYEFDNQPESYIRIERTWSNNDEVTVTLPMTTHFVELPNVPEYVALMHGPILLAAKTGEEDLDDILAGEARMGHIAYGKLYALNEAPVIVSSRESILEKIEVVDREKFTFRAPALFESNHNKEYKDLVLQPFSEIHDARYMMYWMQLTQDEYQTIYDQLAKEEAEKLALEALTVDQIGTGEQQPDSDHNLQGVETYSGTYKDIFYRDARNGGWFSYDMNTKGEESLKLRVTYWGYETGNRTFDIIVEGETIVRENISGKWQLSDFCDAEYEIPVELAKGKEKINVKFAATANNTAGGVYYIRLMKDDRENKQYFEVSELANINTGTVSSERNFDYKISGSSTGTHNGESWRDCYNGYIQYTIPTNQSDSMSLKVRYWGNESHQRCFDIIVNDEVVATEDIIGKWNTSSFQNVEYGVPARLISGKENAVVKFVPKSGNYAGGLFRMWAYGYKAENIVNSIETHINNDTLEVYTGKEIIDIRTKDSTGKIKIFNMAGMLLFSEKIENQLSVPAEKLPCHQSYIVMFSSDKGYVVSRKITLTH